MDSVHIIDISAGEFCDGPTRKGSVGQKSLDSGDRHQFDWLGTRSRSGHAGVDWEVILFGHLDHLGGNEQFLVYAPYLGLFVFRPQAGAMTLGIRVSSKAEGVPLARKGEGRQEKETARAERERENESENRRETSAVRNWARRP